MKCIKTSVANALMYKNTGGNPHHVIDEDLIENIITLINFYTYSDPNSCQFKKLLLLKVNIYNNKTNIIISDKDIGLVIILIDWLNRNPVIIELILLKGFII